VRPIYKSENKDRHVGAAESVPKRGGEGTVGEGWRGFCSSSRKLAETSGEGVAGAASRESQERKEAKTSNRGSHRCGATEMEWIRPLQSRALGKPVTKSSNRKMSFSKGIRDGKSQGPFLSTARKDGGIDDLWEKCGWGGSWSITRGRRIFLKSLNN